MQDNKKTKVVIAGGGTSGWIAAAALGKQMGKMLDITLVESDDIGTIGVGEASIPPMRVFHKLLGIDEQAFMRATNATFKLGISFENWGLKGDKYIHSFGTTGQESYLAGFHHFWLHSLNKGFDAEFGEYCVELQAAKENKFATSEKSNINYAYHLDATKYAAYLRTFSEAMGVNRIEGKIASVIQNKESQHIESLVLENGKKIDGDLFIDCTGFKGLLIEQTLNTGYEDWSHWLPCDSAIAVQTESSGELKPYTRSIAHDSGWQWQIPLQHRTGNGLVFCSKYLSDDDAKSLLLENLSGKPLNEPRVIKYKTGKRRKAWNKNCIALGLSSGFVEPLESTSIYLFMMGIIRLMRLFPSQGIQQSTIEEYNRLTDIEIEKIRDFIILHYHATERDDSPFWRYCKNMDIPDTLSHRLDLFRKNAHAFQADGELFRVDSWTQVMLGQRVMPESYHPIVKTMSDKELTQFLNGYRNQIKQVVNTLPKHQDFVEKYCKSQE